MRQPTKPKTKDFSNGTTRLSKPKQLPRPTSIKDLDSVPNCALSEEWIASYLMAGHYEPAIRELSPNDFFDPIYREVFQVGLKLVSDGVSEANRVARIVDAISVHDSSAPFVLAGELAGWKHYSFGKLDYHIQKVKIASNARKIYATATALLRQALEMPEDLMEQYQSMIGTLDVSLTAIDPKRSMQDVLFAAMDDIERRRQGGETIAVSTGFDWIDAEIGGFERTETVVVAAKSGGGKSAWVSNVAVHNCEVGRSVVFISLEMTENEVMNRLVSIVSGVDLKRIRRGQISDNERRELSETFQRIANWKLRVIQPTRCTVGDVELICEQHREETGSVDMLVVDYLGLMDPDDARAPRHEQLEQISRGLKKLATKQDCVAFPIHQLNREGAKGRPEIHLLKGSSNIEQDANNVIFLYCEKPDPSSPTEELELIFAKMRNDACHKFAIQFEKRCLRFIRCGEEF